MREILESLNLNQSRDKYFSDLLNNVLSKSPGNIVEIGLGFGENTKVFLKVAKKYGREVLGIDPFESDWPNMPESYRYAYDKFLENVKGYDNLALHKFPSQHSSCLGKILQFDPIAFIFVDGLQSKEAVLADLALCEKIRPAVICVDDADRLSVESRVPEALEEYKGDYKVIKTGREAYLCL